MSGMSGGGGVGGGGGVPRLLLLTDRAQLRLGRGLVRTVAECAEAGLTHVVLRELDLSHDHRAALAEALAATGVTVIAAHGPLPAATGVHLPSPAGPAACHTASHHLGARHDGLPDGVTTRDSGVSGRSCHTVAEVEAAGAEGFDYVTLGPYAATPSKPGYPVTLGAGDWAAAATAGPRVLALGGITPDNAAAAVAGGAHGVAVMGAVMRAADPAGVVAALVTALAGALADSLANALTDALGATAPTPREAAAQ